MIELTKEEPITVNGITSSLGNSTRDAIAHRFYIQDTNKMITVRVHITDLGVVTQMDFSLVDISNPEQWAFLDSRMYYRGIFVDPNIDPDLFLAAPGTQTLDPNTVTPADKAFTDTVTELINKAKQ